MSIETILFRARCSERPANRDAGMRPAIVCSTETIVQRFSSQTINP